MPGRYVLKKISGAASLDLEDEKLLEEDNLGPQDSKRSRHHNKAGPWLKKTEYISTEFNRYGVSNDKTETKLWCVQIRSKQALSAFFDIGKETSSIMVYSFICKSVTFGGYKVQKSYDSDLWVDFNLDGQSLSLYCADLNRDEHVSNSQSLWETIMLEKNNVVYCSTAFGVNQEYQLINIQLNRPCVDLIGNSTSHKIHGNNVLIVLPEDDIVHSLLQNIYGEMYQGQVVASSQSYDDSNEENPNVSKLETEINSNQPFTVSSTVNKNILKSNSCHTPLEEGLKSSETSRDVHMSSSKVEVNLPDNFCNIKVVSTCAAGKLNPPKDNSWEIITSSYLHSKESTSTSRSNEVTPSKGEKNYRSRRVQTTVNSELSAAKTLYTFTEDSGLGSSVSAKSRKYKNKNKVPPIKKVEKRSGRSSKNLKSKKTMEAYTSICSENAQSEEIKGKSRFSMRGRTYPPLKISGLYSFTSSEDEPQDPEVIWLSQKKAKKIFSK
ncbi:uncharacterized protein LOC143246748 isoform X3 [Tachypleus tridentatus]|uniref:uncharacterized protein LOC143246748 isoform X3 n=1 Tax=Tachypleus tridentatus TaxID=6853 RepID=UPI003FD5E3CC